jgi:hypothetical protein
LSFEREKIVLTRASSCRPSLLLVFCFKKKVLMRTLEKALERISKGAAEVNVFFRLDLESMHRLMAACCAVSSEVKKLDLESCGLNAEVVEVIASSLRSNDVLTELDLGRNEDIGPWGAQAVSTALCVNRGLNSLRLYGCNVGDEGAGHLALALRQHRVLKKLFLGNNGITYVGAVTIAAALPFNETLRRLSIDDNVLGDDGVEALANAVPHSGLQELSLYETRFGERGCAALVEMLKNGSHLRELVTDVLHWPALEEGFRCNGWLLDFAPKRYLERNQAVHKRARTSVYVFLLIRKLRRTALSSLPKELVREIAQLVYSSRGEIFVWQAHKLQTKKRRK